MSIELKNLLKTYGTQRAVNDVSFCINKGEIVGFLGPNGAGKSTTFKIITGYLKQDNGTANVCGINVAENPLAGRRKIGYLPEANPLYYDMYVREYLSFIAGVHKVAKIKKAVNDVLEMAGLIPEAGKKIGQLSKGYKQRTGLAAALVHDPEVLLLDEPTSGLDPNQIIEIRNVIKAQGKNKTVLFSSHVLQEVQSICSRIIIIHHGKIVADNTMENLQAMSGLKRLKIAFDPPVQEAVFHRLPGIQKVEKLNTHFWALTAKDITLLRKNLMEMAVEKNLDIQSLEVETDNLEDIFRQLTKN